MDSADKVLEIVWSRRSDFDQAMSCQRLLYSAEWQAAKTQVFLQSPQLLKTLFFIFYFRPVLINFIYPLLYIL